MSTVRPHGLAWVPVSGRRITTLRVFGLLLLVLMAIRLVLVSVYPSPNYRSLAAAEGYNVVKIQATRGTIFDSSGATLAISTPSSTVVADPLLIRNPIDEAKLLSQILGIAPATLRAQMLSPGQFVYIAHQISNAQAKTITANMPLLPGISLINEPLRVDPNGAMAASVLGNVSLYGTGQGGIEEMLNPILSGEPGSELLYSDPSGSTLPNGVKVLTRASNGKSVQLTLNASVQLQTEQELSNEMIATQSRAGVAIMVNTKTGSIVSMANLVAGSSPNQGTSVYTPYGTPQQTFDFTQQSPINMAVDYVYEPGSVAKIATFAAALKAGVITPASEILVPDHLTVGGANFHDAEVHATQIMSPKEILAQSSNVGTIMIASHLTPETINDSFLNFGWGRYSGIGLPGESAGFLDPPSHWSGTAPGSVPIGQDEAVTPLAVLDSYSAIANQGFLTTPHLVAKINDHTRPVGGHRVMTPALARVMTSLLSGVTGQNATAPSSAIPGFQISGKTGTAQIPYGGGRSGYIPGAFMATFVGYTTNSSVPLAEIVVLTEPDIIYGGLTSAKVFSQTMSYALYHFGAVVAVSNTAMADRLPKFSNFRIANSDLASNCHYEAHRFGASLFGANCRIRSNGLNTAAVGAI